jgi:hypothetical protein
VTLRQGTRTKTPLRKGFLRSLVRWFAIGVVLIWALAALMLVAARWIDPPTTAVHAQRRRRPGFTTGRITAKGTPETSQKVGGSSAGNFDSLLFKLGNPSLALVCFRLMLHVFERGPKPPNPVA